jgi:glycosyltransferase involved in cell wall biosynthesis
MKFLLVEPEFEGHYMILYVRFILRVLNQHGHEVFFLTTKESTKHVSFNIIKKECPNIKIFKIKRIKPKSYSSIDLIIYQYRLFQQVKYTFEKISKENKIDHVFLNSFDHFDKIISLFGSPFKNIKFSGIIVNPKFYMGEFGLGTTGRFVNLSKFLFKKLLKNENLKKIFSNDPFFIKYIKSRNIKNYGKLNFLIEPREFKYNFTKKYSLNKLKLPKKGIYILVYGAIKESKGIKTILEVLNNPLLNQDIKFIFAGKLDNNTKIFLKNSELSKKFLSQKKLFIFNKFQNDIEESLLFDSSDLIWIGYNKDFPFLSGVFFQAAVKNKPVIASDHGIIGNNNKKYKLGYSVNVNNKSEIVKKINDLCLLKIRKKFIINSKKLSEIANPKYFMRQIYKNLI